MSIQIFMLERYNNIVLMAKYVCFPLLTEPGQDIDWEDEAAVLSNLTCIAISGIEDPVRDEVQYVI